MKKVDYTTHNKSDKEKYTQVFQYKASEYKSPLYDLTYTIYRLSSIPDTWFVSSSGICEMVNLHTNDLEEAELKASCHMREKLRELIAELDNFVIEIEQSLNIS